MVGGPSQIGLSHSVPERTTIVHSTVIGRNSGGRVADLYCAWLEQECSLGPEVAGRFRALIPALLDSVPKPDSAASRIELAAFGGHVLIAVRSECRIPVEPGNHERTFTQFWLDRDETKLLRKILDPTDRIEVRYQEKSNLVEWRVCRNLDGAVDPHEAGGFFVYSDTRDSLAQNRVEYRDLGDTPYREWLEEVYRSAGGESASGEILVRGEESQSADERIRIKVSAEILSIEEQSGSEGESWKKRREGMIGLLHRKERELFQQEQEIRRFRSEREEAEQARMRNPFREKAIEMYQKLRELQQRNEELLAQIRGGGVGLDFSPADEATGKTGTEDLEKRLDRVQRMLEAEKSKIKGLLDRTLSAEKEAQASAPIISDLEARMEHTLKTSIQYKKEIDALKLKIVQSEAEKNKIKNELLKAQAQIQTLLKRQAA
jgi:hypothetical protein